MASSRPRLLDLFCGQGGAAMGYHRAGFEVVGVDISPQPRYPFEFHQADALQFPMQGFDAIHASPPCQAHSQAQHIRQNQHPDLIWPVRQRLRSSGLPWIIENVVNAPLLNPVMLCGTMFGLRTYRHRLFESNIALSVPAHPPHTAKVAKMGRRVADGEFMHVVGNFVGADLGREVMGMPWASRDGLREAIPPAYAEHLGAQLIRAVMREAA